MWKSKIPGIASLPALIRLTGILFFVVHLQSVSFGQIVPDKSLTAVRVADPPKIDAILDEEVWDHAPYATDFIQIQPYNGRPASFPSSVKILYDDYSLYVGAMLYDPFPDSIMTELSMRDEIKIADYFGIYIDPYNDYITAYGFIVTASGVQIDLKSLEGGGEDESWDAVWKSEVSIADSGWIVEYEIPYSALRFPSGKKEQVWGLQIFRNIMRYREKSSWNFIDREKEGINNQAGELHGIGKIEPPLRLSLVPYLSGYVEKSPEFSDWSTSYNYGMDVKYGISESFTLDMTLIPDFGQVESDDRIFNLSPYEVYYGEKRPFFTEGTELFQKGNAFYSRRIGAEPGGYGAVEDSLSEHEIISENPQNAQLINATKVSGKTPRGLAMGFFNAMTSNTYVTVNDTLTGESRRILTEPFTNFNMVVFEQSLPSNSYVSAYNTNVYKPHDGYSANVSGGDFKFADRSNTYAVRGQGAVSQKYNKHFKPDFGHRYFLDVGKISGKYTYGYGHRVISDTYDPNDMGFQSRNNEFENEVYIEHRMYEPTWKLLEWSKELEISYDMLYSPREFTGFSIDLSSRALFKNHLTVWMSGVVNPVNSYDYFKPRVEGRFFTQPPNFAISMGFSPDYRKTFVVDLRAGMWRSWKYDQFDHSVSIEPRFRVNDHLMIIHEFDYNNMSNDVGHVADTTGPSGEPVIIFGIREVDRYENTLNIDYTFNNKSSLGFRLRHYWLTGRYNDYYDLRNDGSLIKNDYQTNHNFSYNAFNIDLAYIWNFAPGSEVSLVWKNAIFTYDDKTMVDENTREPPEITYNFYDNLNQTLDTPASNSFSIKVIYYLDYLYLKKMRRRSSG